MPKRATIATREYLKQVPLPQHATSYTVITHETVITNALEQLKLKGFKVTDEKYRTNSSGEVAVGRYYLTYGNDPELGMMFAWANSYDKTMRFKCAVGGFVRSSESSIISGDFNWGRKHTGTADQEMIAQVNNQIMNGQIYYENILSVKDQMKRHLVGPDKIAEFLGKAFFTAYLFSKEQIGVVRDEIQKPSFDYNADPNSLWTQYNHMLVALKKAHPRTWMDEQRELHSYICSEFGIQSLTGTSTAASGISNGDPTATNGSTGVSTPTITITTTASTTDEPMVITIDSIDGPVSIYSEQEEDKLVKKMNIEEFADVKQDSIFEKTINTSDSKLLNGFNNGRDTTDGVGGEPAPGFNLTPEMFDEEVEIIPPNHTMGVPNTPDELDLENAKVDEEKSMDRANPETYESDITPEQQKQIDDAIANLDKIKIKAPSLTLPD